ncbi:hypothetical protein [Agrobacterium rubi]|uniref:hypothetical protein n=1 Tax=Agrobacterium rubi TaxID=28099 RepID=UPI00201B75CF|nr:hypothetical protein [Agrobacterium rubi]
MSVKRDAPIAALEDRDVDWVDVTGWGVLHSHAIPVSVAREIANDINLYHAHRASIERKRCLEIVDQYHGGGRSFVMRKISNPDA